MCDLRFWLLVRLWLLCIIPIMIRARSVDGEIWREFPYGEDLPDW